MRPFYSPGDFAMMNLPKMGLIFVLISSLFLACEEEDILEDLPLPLAGTYTLSSITIAVGATTLRDTMIHFGSSQNGIDSLQLNHQTQVLNSSILYSNTDENPVGGTILLNNDGSANLNGDLPVNFGTGCYPLILVSTLTSDGIWSVDTTTGTFEIDLVLDALDIDGTYTLDGDHIEIRYFTLVEIDERMISSVSYEGVDTEIIPMCIPVSTITERIMQLTLN